MKKLFAWALLAAMSTAAIAKPLASDPNFNGKFHWLKLGKLSAATAQTFANAKQIEIVVGVSRTVKVKKDAHGNAWVSLIVADQGADWKWHQTTGNGGIPASNGVLKQGAYRVRVPVSGIPRSVLAGKMQTVSVGPASSGLEGTTGLMILAIRGN